MAVQIALCWACKQPVAEGSNGIACEGCGPLVVYVSPSSVAPEYGPERTRMHAIMNRLAERYSREDAE